MRQVSATRLCLPNNFTPNPIAFEAVLCQQTTMPFKSKESTLDTII